MGQEHSMTRRYALGAAGLALAVAGCGGGGSGDGEAVGGGQQVATAVDLTDLSVANPTANITSQCYTKTEAPDGQVSNPCFTCHAQSQPPNYISGMDLQQNYSFPIQGTTNPYVNLFEDGRPAIAEVSDQAILRYIREDNYKASDGSLVLAERLRDLPVAWDAEGDGEWDGYIPDAHFDFDGQGFDRAPDGSYTGWRAFSYYLFPGTFWPTNGSTDDVLIRLAPAFRQDANGNFDLTAYKVNLAIVEALVKEEDVPIESVSEARFGVDLDRDGELGEAQRIAFSWHPEAGRNMSYVGYAQGLQNRGEVHLAAGLFPKGTEFLHSVRYIDVTEDGSVSLAPRMRELRYARKDKWLTYSELWGIAHLEARERRFDADATKAVAGDFERGMKAQGWRYQGFIEAADGSLRPQSQEETFFCMGCHGAISATTDTVFSFSRKFASDRAFRRGWYHWSQKGMQGVPEPRREDGSFEYTRYLRINRAGDEFRANQEVVERFFHDDGTLREDAVGRLHEDISYLLFPSRERALELNKAYQDIVRDQDFVDGRDTNIAPAGNVHREVSQGEPTGVEEPVER